MEILRTRDPERTSLTQFHLTEESQSRDQSNFTEARNTSTTKLRQSLSKESADYPSIKLLEAENVKDLDTDRSLMSAERQILASSIAI